MPRLPTVSVLLLLIPAAAHAKDLRKRVGVGFDSQIGASPTGGVSALSVRVGLPTPNPAMNILVEGDVGVDSPGALFLGGRALYGVVAEDNLNVYLGGGAGTLTTPTATAFRVQPVMAVDFFLFGLENLGFTTGWGLDIDMGKTSRFATTASASVGAHYWF